MSKGLARRLAKSTGAFWESFLPIATAVRTDAAPTVNATWLATRGFALEAPAVLRALREHVLPLVRRLEKTKVISWFSFLLHDHTRGVPTVPEDRGAYVHLRVCAVGKGNFAKSLPVEWLWTRCVKEPTEIAGIDEATIRGGASAVFDLLGAQSVWYLRLLEAHAAGTDDAVVLRQVRQFFHFFANMAQVEVA